MGKQKSLKKKRNLNIQEAVIPYHILQRFSVFSSIHRKEMFKACVPANMRAYAKGVLKSIKPVAVPPVPPEITKKEREKIDKLAVKVVRNHYRPNPDYYKIPLFVKRKRYLKNYFLERLRMEIELRDGYVCQ